MLVFPCGKIGDFLSFLLSSFACISVNSEHDKTIQNTIGVPFLFQWQSGKLIPVYPASQAQASPQYPKKAWA